MRYDVSVSGGSAAAFHGRPLPDPARHAVWGFDVERPAVVLGSRQSDALIDVDRCRREGIEVVRRRSGGGVVLLVPGQILWVDVVVPASDRSVPDDVHGSMVWMGERWVAALDGLVEPAPAVHRGGLERTAWSELVCFAGLGPGEVTVGARKLVGISQRRSRAGARFQCAVHLHVDLERTIGLLVGPLPPHPPASESVAVLATPVTTDDLVARLMAVLAER